MNSNRELRFAGSNLHAGPGNIIEGLAVPYNSTSRHIPGVGRERMLPGVFDASLRRAEAGEQDILMNASHMESMLLGSHTMGNLDLYSDPEGLRFQVRVPSHSEYGMAAVDAVRQGTLSGCSFSFSPLAETRAADGAREVESAYLHHITICKPQDAAYGAAGAEARMMAQLASEYRSVGFYELRSMKYLVVESDGTRHLPVTDDNGKPDHHLMGAAWAALHGGYRGNRYEGPNRQQAISRLKRMYRAEGLDFPPSGRTLNYNDPLDRTIMDAELHRAFLRVGGESRVYASVDQVPVYVPKDSRKQWMDIWNSAFKKAKKDGLSDKDAESKAFAEASGVIKKEAVRN